MGFNSRTVALLIASIISVITTAFLFLVEGVSNEALAVTFALSFCSSFIFIYFTYELLIFREINKLHNLVTKLKRKDLGDMLGKVQTNFGPVNKINEEIHTYAALKQKEIDELKKLAAYRREFLADISHELKTPLFAAQGFIHTLLDGAIDDKSVRIKFLNKAAKNLDGLNSLVKDILTISMMESGEMQLEFENANIVELVKEVFEQLDHNAEKKGVKLKLKTDLESEKAIAYVDPFRIRQVFRNLIENSIKYGENGIKVKVKIIEAEGYFVIHVKDNGPGISEEHLGRIFERFYRVEKSRSKSKGGSGLGLAIAKHIIKAHESEIFVKSKLGKGTEFIFKLNKPELEEEINED